MGYTTFSVSRFIRKLIYLSGITDYQFLFTICKIYVLLKQKLIDFLVCPTCRNSVHIKIKKKKGTEIIEGLILCDKCKDRFNIHKGIPRFVVDKTKDFVRTEEAFSAKWRKHHKNHQAKDWVDFQRKWFLDRYGWKTKSNFDKFLKIKTKILDAGTGIGNSAKFLSSCLLYTSPSPRDQA